LCIHPRLEHRELGARDPVIAVGTDVVEILRQPLVLPGLVRLDGRVSFLV
jgi:hypothetical protein